MEDHTGRTCACCRGLDALPRASHGAIIMLQLAGAVSFADDSRSVSPVLMPPGGRVGEGQWREHQSEVAEARAARLLLGPAGSMWILEAT